MRRDSEKSVIFNLDNNTLARCAGDEIYNKRPNTLTIILTQKMKRFYTTLLMITALVGVAVAQDNVQTMPLRDIFSFGQLSEFYTIEKDLIGV